jgi:ribosome-associated toxin RatA of RatAB toxin-antitoxin module
MTRLEHSIDIDAPIAVVQAVITDFASYPRFVPHVESTEILHTDPADPLRQQVRFTINLLKRIRYTLDLRSNRDGGLEWSLVEGPFARNDGGWRLQALTAERTRATYSIDLKLTAMLPRFIETRLVAQSLPETLQAFREEAEQRAGHR